MGNNKDTALFVRFEEGWKDRLKAAAKKGRRTMSDMARIFIEEGIEKMEEEK